MLSFPRGEHCIESEMVVSAGATLLSICISHGLYVVGQNYKLKNVVLSC